MVLVHAERKDPDIPEPGNLVSVDPCFQVPVPEGFHGNPVLKGGEGQVRPAGR
jgi:hypothetical protein